MKSLIIVKAGSTFPVLKQTKGDFEDWVMSACGSSDGAFSVINISEGEALPPVDRISGVIMTGSHAMVTDQEPWMQVLASWISPVLDRSIPLLGICFGHQLLAQAMGGRVDYQPKGREIGTVAITLTEEGKKDILFESLPDKFMVHTTHAQTVIQLPANAVNLAENSFEGHHAFRLGDKAWGVQFHPEFTADIMKVYVSQQTPSLLNEGHDLKAIEATISNTDEANTLLKRFMRIVQENMI